MKIIQINASYKPAYVYGGPTLSVSRLCEGLVRSGTDLEVLTTTANGTKELSVKLNKPVLVDNVSVTYFKRLTKDHTHFSPSLLNALKQKLSDKRQNPIVHIHAWWNLVSVFSCWIAKANGIPVVLSPRGTLSSYSFGNRNSSIKSYIHRFLGKSLLEYCHIHVTSEQEKQDIQSLLKPRSITVIPNFVYLPEISNKIEKAKSWEVSSREPLRLLFLSRIEEKKGLDILFNALCCIDIPYILDIAGSGDDAYMEELKKLALKLDIAKSINWIGQQNQEEKWQVMERHDLLVLTSHNENFANVVIECLASGTGVLISEKVGLAEYVRDNNLGWVCELSIDSVKEKLTDAYAHTEKLESIRNIAPKKIRSDFEESKLIDNFIDMYKKASK